MKNFYLVVSFAVLIIFIIINAFIFWQFNKINTRIDKTNSLVSQNIVDNFQDYSYYPERPIENCVLEYNKKISAWNIYEDRDNCFSIQYPEDWHYFVEENYPLYTISFDDQRIDYPYPGENTTIELRLDLPNTGIFGAVDAAMLKNPTITHFRDIQDIRLTGQVKDETTYSWNYLDKVYIYRQDTNQVLTISYFESEYSEKNRNIFNNILSTLKFGQ